MGKKLTDLPAGSAPTSTSLIESVEGGVSKSYTATQIVEAGLANGSLTAAKFALSIEPVGLVSSVPLTLSTQNIYNTTDHKLYHWNGSAYVATVPAADITGQLTDSQLADIAAAKITGQITATQITDGSITTPKLFAGAVTTAKIAADAVTANEIAANAVTTAKLNAGAVTTAKLAADAVTANELAANSVVAGKVAAGAISATEISVSSLAAISADLGEVTAGSIRGVNVNAASHTTKGSYLTSAASAADATLHVKNTADFPASGTGVVIDTLAMNDRDVFTYTGKTGTTLTGCSGVLAHNSGATVVPLAKCVVIDAATNQIRFFGDRGDGTIVEMGNVGTRDSADLFMARFGSNDSEQGGVAGLSDVWDGVSGFSVSGSGVVGASTSGYGGSFTGNATSAPLCVSVLDGRPTNRLVGQIAVIRTTGGSTDARTATPRPMYTDGTDWRLMSDDTVWNG